MKYQLTVKVQELEEVDVGSYSEPNKSIAISDTLIGYTVVESEHPQLVADVARAFADSFQSCYEE